MNMKFQLELILLILSAIAISAQEPRVNDRGQIIVSPEQIEANKRMHDLMLNPSFIMLRLGPISGRGKETSTEAPAIYRTGDHIDFQLYVTNSLAEMVQIEQHDPYSDIRPELFRDGDPVPYRKAVQEILEKREKEPHFFRSVPSHLAPGKEYNLELVNLKDWYKSLPPGHYQLSVRRQFVYGGEWVQSNSVTFDVQ